MTKKEVKQLLPFNTITKCEKEYHRLVKERNVYNQALVKKFVSGYFFH